VIRVGADERRAPARHAYELALVELKRLRRGILGKKGERVTHENTRAMTDARCGSAMNQP